MTRGARRRTRELPVTRGARPGATARADRDGVVEPVFTPEILDQYTAPGRPPATVGRGGDRHDRTGTPGPPRRG